MRSSITVWEDYFNTLWRVLREKGILTLDQAIDFDLQRDVLTTSKEYLDSHLLALTWMDIQDEEDGLTPQG